MESSSSRRMYSVRILVAGIALLIQLGVGFAQNCGCAANLCCSKFGFCGSTSAYCGDGCQSGPCTQSGSTPATGGGDVGSIISRSFFENIMSKVPASCEGKGFYTYDAFVSAANAYSGFGTTGSDDIHKRELAAFFANAMHETGEFCHINEVNPPQIYCQSGTPCASGKSYHGRGPLQLSWNYNYQAAGQNIGFDGINNPDIVGQDATVSFKAAFWFWMINSNCHQVITSGQGFGATIKAINSMECNGGNTPEVNSRVGYYNNICQQLGVDPGSNVSC